MGNSFFYNMLKEIEKLKKFDKWRKSSIQNLEEGLIDKEKFLELNYSFINKLEIKPYSKINNILEGIYNYQYYNILAKRSNYQANKYLNNPKKKKLYTRYINDRENYYCLKDITTKAIIELIKYQNIESYYIKLISKRLTGKIFEIVLLDYEKVILHSKSSEILRMLKDNMVFDENIRESKINEYVNRSY